MDWLRSSGLFDAVYYLETYPEGAVLRLEPAEHYKQLLGNLRGEKTRASDHNNDDMPVPPCGYSAANFAGAANTLRPCVSRLVRETLSCSQTLAHHISASKYCIGHYHLEQAGAFPG